MIFKTLGLVKSIFKSILFSIFYLFVIGYIDFGILSPMILPKDHCYYHFNDTPYLIELFYMNGSSNGHPEWSFTHLFLLLGISVSLGILTVKKSSKNL